MICDTVGKDFVFDIDTFESLDQMVVVEEFG